MSDRNPSPPPGISDEIKNPDTIGDTAYSKRWLYTLLMRVIQHVSSTNGEEESDEPKDLDPDFEEELCCLWDMTVNRDVLKYLEEFDIVSLFTAVLACPRYPRLLEITAGILANMAYEPSECHRMTENETFISNVIQLMYLRDAPTLTEVCRCEYGHLSILIRLIQTVLATVENTSPWINEIRFQQDFVDNILFILRSSTSAPLLIGAIRLVDAITREDDSLAEIWCGSQLLDAILIAQHQMKWLHGSEVEVIHRLLYTFSSNMNGVAALNPQVIPCSLYIASACQKQINEYPMVRGILADLRIFFKDLVKSIEKALSSASDSNDTSSEFITQNLQWLIDLDKTVKNRSRDIFLSCCLNDGDTETKTCLISIFNQLKLSRLLECVTDD